MFGFALTTEHMFAMVAFMRTRVRRRRLAAGVLGAALCVQIASVAAHAVAPHRGHELGARTYVVRPGDTLWKIASRLQAPGADPRPLVDELAARNHLTGALHPGQALVLPTP
jgi:nucleoid-associated protein YgaU